MVFFCYLLSFQLNKYGNYQMNNMHCWKRKEKLAESHVISTFEHYTRAMEIVRILTGCKIFVLDFLWLERWSSCQL
jgi:hypothetical protein